MSCEAGLLQALTATDRLSELLPVLHQHAVAFSLDRLPQDAWPGRMVPEGLFQNGTPRLVHDMSCIAPPMLDVLGPAPAVLVPLVHVREAIGVLMMPRAPSAPEPHEAASVGRAFVVALERARAAAEADLQQQLREQLQNFARDVMKRCRARFASR